jgi:CheY-like chemotaxis protein
MKTILFADDNKNIRAYCRAAFEDEGYRVVLARDGIEAVRVFRCEAPDVAILDIFMPRSGGLDALEQIKEFAPWTPTILFTANTDVCLVDRRAALATACVEKSEDLGDLKRLVVETLRSPHDEPPSAALRLGLPPLPANMEC